MLVKGITTAPPAVTVTTITDMLTTRATSDTLVAPVVVTLRQAQGKLDAAVVVTALVTESGGEFQKKNIRRRCTSTDTMWGRQPPTWNQSCQGVARGRHLPRGLLRGRAAFTEGERWTGGLLG
jgi:hypothetical protein